LTVPEPSRAASAPPAAIDAGAEARDERAASPASQAAFASAQHIVDDAVTAGRWTQKDFEQIHSLRAELTGAQLIEVQKDLFPAVNSGRVQVTYRGPLL
jgi:hypothetical protein